MKYFVQSTLAVFALVSGFSPLTNAQELRITKVETVGHNQTRVTAEGSTGKAVDLERSQDFKNWYRIHTAPAGAEMSFTDTPPAEVPSFYRLVSPPSSSTPPPTTLPDLANYPNRVFQAPDAFSTIQYAPNGTLGFIAWKDQDLIIRERTTAGSWTETIVNPNLPGKLFVPLLAFTYAGNREDYRFQPGSAFVYDSASKAHVFQATGTTVVHYSNASGTWREVERIANPHANSAISSMQAVMGPNNVLHLMTLTTSSPRNLAYATTRGSGSWSWTSISSVTDADLYYWAPPFAPRWLDIAVDSDNDAHIVYRNAMTISKTAAGNPRANSILRYASNQGGAWRTGIQVQGTFDISGEAANGASIAIAPDGKPRIVSWYDERADTGSAQQSRMYFHQQDAAGNWSGEIIFRTPDGYVAGDGPKGTGFSPMLRYDQSGRPHILFLDHAGEHFPVIGQQEYAGNLRHAWLNGNSWQVETLHRQTNPLTQQIVYPTFAMNGNELAVTFLQRDTSWRMTSYPPINTGGAYYFRFLTKQIQ